MSYTIETPIGTLRPSLRAAMQINATCGNYFDQLQGLVANNFSTYVAIAAAGLNRRPADIESEVFAAGLDVLNEPLTKFVKSLINGGRDPERSPNAAGALTIDEALLGQNI